jgi:endonuclease G
MAMTFLLSNMSPQTPKLNRDIWRILEEQIRNMVLTGGEAWIFTGNAFLSPDSHFVNPSEFIGPDSIAVPTHCFKAVLYKDNSGKYTAYAFLIPNQRETIPGTPADYLISVDKLEKITNYDFFYKLDDSLENRIEGAVPSVWPR